MRGKYCWGNVARHAVFALCVGVAALALVSCTVKEPRPVLPPVGTGLPDAASAGDQVAPSMAVRLPPAGTYRIDSSGSELRLLVYRAGALSSLGHNHVIVNRSVTGSIETAPTLHASSFALRAPIAAMVVDDVQARAEEGEDFRGEISDEAKLGTFENLSGAAVLNAIQYPVITVRSTSLEQSHGQLTAIMTVNVAGHESTVSVPFVMKLEAYGLSASASFEVRQSTLGLTPFSLMLGALAVRDEVQVKLRIAAQLETPR